MKKARCLRGQPRHFAGSDIPRINPGTGFPSGPRIPCTAPGTVEKKEEGCQFASKRQPHQRDTAVEMVARSGAGCLTGTSLSRFLCSSQQPVTSVFVTDVPHPFKGCKQSPARQTLGKGGCPL